MISREDIEKLAELSRLKLAPEEAAELQRDFSSILDYVGQLQSYEAGAGEEAPSVRNVMRADEAGRGVGGTPEALLAAAPEVEDGYIVVRKIIQRDE